MAGDSVSTLILFIAAMLVAAGVAGVLVTNVNDITNSIDTHSTDVREKIDTDVEIISDPGSNAVYDTEGNETITLLIKNTGDRTLDSDGNGIDVLVNGEYVSDEDWKLEVVSGETWRTGEVAQLEIDRELTPGEHRVTVDVNGDREVFEFYYE